jgi:hypothetical protein
MKYTDVLFVEIQTSTSYWKSFLKMKRVITAKPTNSAFEKFYLKKLQYRTHISIDFYNVLRRLQLTHKIFMKNINFFIL